MVSSVLLEEPRASRKVKPHANCKEISSLPAGTLLSTSERGRRIVEKRKPTSSGTKKIVARKTVHILGQNTRSSLPDRCPTRKTSRHTNGWNDWRNPRTKKVTKYARTFVDRWIQSLLLKGSWVHPCGSGTAMVESGRAAETIDNGTQTLEEGRCAPFGKSRVVRESQRILEKASRKSSVTSNNSHQRRRTRNKRLRRKQKHDTAVYCTPVISLDVRCKASIQTFEASPRRDLRCGHGGREAE